MRPMLAVNAPDLKTLNYPLFSSEKLDGIRCVIKDGVAYSRTLKPIRNQYIQSVLGRPELNGLDGELIVDKPNAKDCMRVTNSGVMSESGIPEFTYYVFDYWDRSFAYSEALWRIMNMRFDKISANVQQHVKVLKQETCSSQLDVEYHEQCALAGGFEGLILRRPDAPYKFGRATAKEGFLLKLKRYEQQEAVVVGYEPLAHNDNEPELDALGYKKRSTARAGKIELPLLGSLLVQGVYAGNPVRFSIGTGFTAAEREWLWLDREGLIGKIVSYKFFPTGAKDRPRHPIFISFRDAIDM